MKQLGLAFHNYADTHKALPIGVVGWPITPAIPPLPAGMPGHTALALVLPFHEQANVLSLYHFDVRNVHPSNRDATSALLEVYQCPSDNSSRRAKNASFQSTFGRSNVAVSFGSDTFLRESLNINITSATDQTGVDKETDGAFRIDGARRFADLTDGTSNITLASEVLSGQDDSISAPGDTQWDVRGLWAFQMIGASSYTHRNPPNAAVGDVLFSSGQLNCVAFTGAPCDNTAGGQWDLFHAAARSHHPRGVNVLFGDGHVRFVANTIELLTWQHLGSINDGNPISDF